MYCTNLTGKAKNGELDAIIGRDREIARVIQILSRRTKNNPCLIGEPGVGKTAMAEGTLHSYCTGKCSCTPEKERNSFIRLNCFGSRNSI